MIAFIRYGGALDKVRALCAIVRPTGNRGGLFTENILEPS